MTVIHFMDLEDMIPELSKDDIVRINTQIKRVHIIIDRPDMSVNEVGLYVRQVVGNTIYSWMTVVGQYESYKGNPFTTQDTEIMVKSIEECERMEDLVTERLLAQADFIIRPGIVDLGISNDQAGFWSFMDIEHVVVDEHDEEEESPSLDDIDIPF
jgi:hypothetical protein